MVVEGVEKPGNLGAVLRTADGAGADAVIAADAADGPRSTRTRSGPVPRHDLRAARLRRRRRPAVLDWLRGPRRPARRRDASTPRRAYTEVDLRGPVAIVLGSEAEGLTGTWHGPAGRRRCRSRCAAPGRQPERLGRRGRAALRGGAAAHAGDGPATPRHTDAMETFDFVDHRRRTGRRGRRLQGPRAAARPSRSSTGAGSAAAARTSAACRRSPSSTAPPSTPPNPAGVSWDAGVGAPRLHGQPAGRTPPSRTTPAMSAARGRRGDLLSRERPDRRPAAASRSATTMSAHELHGRQRRHRGRVALEGAADPGPRRRPDLDEPRGDARPRAAAEPARARRRPDRLRAGPGLRPVRRPDHDRPVRRPARCRPSTPATPRRSRDALRARRRRLRLGVRAMAARAGAGSDGAHVIDLDDGSTAEGHAILLAVGRTFPLDDLGLEHYGIDTSGRMAVPARRSPAHRRRPLGDRRPGRARAAHPPGPLPGRDGGPDGAGRSTSRPTTGPCPGRPTPIPRRRRRVDARPGEGERASTRSSRRRLRDLDAGLRGRGEDRPRHDRRRSADARARRRRDGLPGRVGGDPRVRPRDPGPGPDRGPRRHDPRVPLDVADPQRPVRRRAVKRPRRRSSRPAGCAPATRSKATSPSTSTSRGRAVASAPPGSTGSVSAVAGRTTRSARWPGRAGRDPARRPTTAGRRRRPAAPARA